MENTMRTQILTLAAMLAMAVPGLSSAAAISGPVTYAGSGIYSGTSTSLAYDPDGPLYSDDEVLLICIDHRTNPPFTYATPKAQFETEAGATAIRGPSGAAGEAAIYWLLDQYYLTFYKTGTIEQRRALQYALWEIGNDYDGSATSINTSTGSSRPALENVIDYGGTDQAAFVTAYTTLYDAMKANLPTLRTSYRSTTYTMDLFRNLDPAYQHMVALIERAPPNTVPVAEPAITGTPQVGATVTGSYTYTDNNGDVEDPSGTGTSYQFVTSPNPSIASASEGTVVASGTTGGAGQTVSYTLQATDLNQYVFFCVKPAAQTGASPGAEVCTSPVGPVTARVVQQAPTPVPGLGLWALLGLTPLIAWLGIGRQRRA